jgi:hypothetical protein
MGRNELEVASERSVHALPRLRHTDAVGSELRHGVAFRLDGIEASPHDATDAKPKGSGLSLD